MSEKNIHFQIGRLEVLIEFMERELNSLKEIHKEITEIASNHTSKTYNHEAENETKDQ